MTELTRLRAQIEAFVPYNEQEEADRRQMLADMDCFSDLLTRENATAHFTASCWIVNPDRKKVLMAYHNLYQSWAWLGGHADGEADLLSVALREANEESGVLAAPSPRISSHSKSCTSRRTSSVENRLRPPASERDVSAGGRRQIPHPLQAG